jgi:hypothetical protein
LAEYGVFVVHEVMPQFDSLLEVAEETGCAYNETTGNWETTFNIRLKTADELQEEAKLKADLIRSERNALLASSDWTQLFDSRVDKEAWGSYRQALRDIPSQTEFPWNVIWPTPPNGS